ncbi:TIP-1 family-domain-containing protein [Mycena floridula]|nr:TIP-1 family-domain-containing protein [Mycena floridula]
MSALEIQTLLSPPNFNDAESKATAYINSKFHSISDLSQLEFQVGEAQKRSNDLKARLSHVNSDLKRQISETREAAGRNLQAAQELSLLRHSLADELEFLSQTLISTLSDGPQQPTLLEEIETLHRSLKELESVKGYVLVIEHALNLGENAVEEARSRPSSSKITPQTVATYQSLKNFVSGVTETTSSVADGVGQQNLHIVEYLHRVCEKTWQDIKSLSSAALLAAAEKLNWPLAVDYASAKPEDRKAFEQSFIHLLELQTIGDSIHADSETSEKDGVYAIQALIQPISLRFKYHFEGTRQTNRADKPEWYFTNIQNVAQEHRPFMESVIQQLLSSSRYRELDAWCEFTLLLLPLISRKLKRTISSLLPHPSLLAHTIYQALTFDASLADAGFAVSRTSASSSTDQSLGKVSEIILGRTDWFDAWVEGEKKFVEDQYQEIISSPDAWQLADDDPTADASTSRDLKTTNSARRVKALVEQVTDRYSPLPSFVQRTRFLISVQLPLLEQYYARISSSLDAFETLSSVLVRAVPGALGVSLGGHEEARVNVDTRRLTSGVEGVQRLCKALLSGKYIESAMDEWGEEVFFLELWTEVNQKAALRARAKATPSLPNPKGEDATVEDTIFGELISQYKKLASRAEDIMLQQVCGEVESSLKSHLSTSANPNTANDDDSEAVSQTLLPTLGLLSTHLTYLRASLSRTIVTRLYRRIAARLSEHVLQRQILYRGNVTAQEGRNILAECELWVETCHGGLGGALGGGRNRLEAPWLRLLEAGRLIGADRETWDKAAEATFGAKNEEDWGSAMVEIVGFNEISREEVGRLLRRREV